MCTTNIKSTKKSWHVSHPLYRTGSPASRSGLKNPRLDKSRQGKEDRGMLSGFRLDFKDQDTIKAIASPSASN